MRTRSAVLFCFIGFCVLTARCEPQVDEETGATVEEISLEEAERLAGGDEGYVKVDAYGDAKVEVDAEEAVSDDGDDEDYGGYSYEGDEADIDEDDMEIPDEIYHRIGRVQVLLDFDVSKRTIGSLESTERKDLMNLWYKFDSYHDYPEDVTTTPRGSLENTFRESMLKEILEGSNDLKVVFFETLATLVPALAEKDPREIPAMTEQEEEAFDEMMEMFDSIVEMIHEDRKDYQKGTMGEKEFKEELSGRLETLILIAGWGKAEVTDTDYMDEAEDWDSEGGMDPFSA